MESTWKALAEPARRRILALLRERPMSTGELCAAVEGMSRFGVMNHLAVLKDAGLLRVEKQGRLRINSLEPGPLQALYEDWLRDYEVLWAGRLGRLKREVEASERRRKAMADKSAGRGQAAGTAAYGAPLAGLLIRQSVTIAAPPAAVFQALTRDLGLWWGAPYLAFPEEARDLLLEPWPDGRLLEVLGEGGSEGYVWGRVEQIRRDRLLTLNGRMGMREAVAGVVRFELNAAGKGTRVDLEHRAVGPLDEATEAAFAEGWRELIGQRLKAYVERGEAAGVRAGDPDAKGSKGGGRS